MKYQSSDRLALLHLSYAEDDIQQGLQILRDYVHNNWEPRWQDVAGELAPNLGKGPAPGPSRNLPPAAPVPATTPLQIDRSHAAPSHQQANQVKWKRGRTGSAGDGVLSSSPSRAPPPTKRVTRSSTSQDAASAPPVKIGRPSRRTKESPSRAGDGSRQAVAAPKVTTMPSIRIRMFIVVQCLPDRFTIYCSSSEPLGKGSSCWSCSRTPPSNIAYYQ